VLVAALVYDAVRGLTGAGNLLTGWVSAKVLIFAVLVLLGLAIRVLSAPLAAALRTMLTQGSTADLEAIVARQLGRIRPIVVAIWLGLIAAAYLGIAKPALG
jgi:Na+-transporting methylmalonyl-CoA/oxaloacetate decarboxylase gamma subunit